MSTLRIFNVSDYVHAGGAPRGKNSYSSEPTYKAGVCQLPDGSWDSKQLPTGGISFMLNELFEYVIRQSQSKEEEVIVFCIDSSPDIKRELYNDVFGSQYGYKGTRPQKTLSMSIQRDAILNVLKLVCNNVLIAPGYEADDIIVWLVDEYKDSYDEVIVHTRDADLFCLVDDNVSIHPVGLRGLTVTKDNYENVVQEKNKYGIPYNCVLLDKLFYGDKSDNIPGVGEPYITTIRNGIPSSMNEYLGNFNLLRNLVSKSVRGDKRVLGILDVLTPLPMPEDYDLTLYTDDILLDRLNYLGALVGNKYCHKIRLEGYQSASTNRYFGKAESKYPDIKEILDYYTDEYYMKGGT